MGRVEYLRENEITELMNTLALHDVTGAGQNHGFAKLLCIKPEAFRHEAEIRILFQDVADEPRAMNGIFLYPLDANTVFEEIVLDPRIQDPAAAELNLTPRAAGCTVPIRQSDLYTAPHFTIRDQ